MILLHQFITFFLRFLDHTQRGTTVGRTPLDEWSSSSQRPLPDNTRHSQQTNIHATGGTRNHDLSRWAAADLRLRPGPAFLTLTVLYLFMVYNFLRNCQIHVRNYVLMFYLYVNKYVALIQPSVEILFPTSNCQCSPFSKKNPIIRIFCISGWLVVPINPDKWSSTV